jgi:hypothetical protein
VEFIIPAATCFCFCFSFSFPALFPSPHQPHLAGRQSARSPTADSPSADCKTVQRLPPSPPIHRLPESLPPAYSRLAAAPLLASSFCYSHFQHPQPLEWSSHRLLWISTTNSESLPLVDSKLGPIVACSPPSSTGPDTGGTRTRISTAIGLGRRLELLQPNWVANSPCTSLLCSSGHSRRDSHPVLSLAVTRTSLGLVALKPVRDQHHVSKSSAGAARRLRGGI